MPIRFFDHDHKDSTADWHGNNAAFTCPVCSKVFVVSSLIDKNGQKCPTCNKTTAFVTGSSKTGEARIEWD
jgi:NAD-dependent SIR2 family protein deacetylase